MSGLEIPALVAGLVGAAASTASAYKDLKDTTQIVQPTELL